MPNRTIGRIGGAAALAIGLLVASALPAAASATHVEIEPSSTVVVQPSTGGAPFLDLHFGHVTSAPCAPVNSQPAAHIPVALDSTSGGTVTPASTNWIPVVLLGVDFKLRLNIVTGSFTFSATGTTLNLTVTLTFATCASTTILCTSNNIAMTLFGSSVGHHPTVSARVPVTGFSASVTTPLSCNATIRALLNGTHLIAALDLHFTDSSA